jgi:hypothetical protein
VGSTPGSSDPGVRIFGDTCDVRWLFLICAAGCYAPGKINNCVVTCATSDDCPGGLACSGGLCGGDSCGVPDDGSSNSDGTMDDSSVVSTCNPQPNSVVTPFNSVIGVVYSSNASIAVYMDNAGQMRQSPAGVNQVGAVIVFEDSVSSQVYNRGRLSPTSDEMFLIHTSMTSSTGTIAVSTRVDNALWTLPVDRTTGITADPTTVLGQVTATDPRLMVIKHAGMLLEGEEALDKSWTFSTLDTSALINFTLIEEPSLSADGLRLLFRGNSGDGMIRAYMASRPDLETRFGNPVSLTDSLDGVTGTERTPAIAPDCSHAFVTIDNGNGVLRLW